MCDVQVHKTRPLLSIRWASVALLSCCPVLFFCLLLSCCPILTLRFFGAPCSRSHRVAECRVCSWEIPGWERPGPAYGGGGEVGFGCMLGNPLGIRETVDRPPGLFSRSDKTLQDIVYKLVPGLFKGVPVLPLLVPSFPFPGLGSSLLTLLRSCR